MKEVRQIALWHSILCLLYAGYLRMYAVFDAQGLAYIGNYNLEFFVPLHYMVALDTVAFSFILLSLFLYTCVYTCVLGFYNNKSKRVLFFVCL
jgi:hypothetical protein